MWFVTFPCIWRQLIHTPLSSSAQSEPSSAPYCPSTCRRRRPTSDLEVLHGQCELVEYMFPFERSIGRSDSVTLRGFLYSCLLFVGLQESTFMDSSTQQKSSGTLYHECIKAILALNRELETHFDHALSDWSILEHYP